MRIMIKRLLEALYYEVKYKNYTCKPKDMALVALVLFLEYPLLFVFISLVYCELLSLSFCACAPTSDTIPDTTYIPTVSEDTPDFDPSRYLVGLPLVSGKVELRIDSMLIEESGISIIELQQALIKAQTDRGLVSINYNPSAREIMFGILDDGNLTCENSAYHTSLSQESVNTPGVVVNNTPPDEKHVLDAQNDSKSTTSEESTSSSHVFAPEDIEQMLEAYSKTLTMVKNEKDICGMTLSFVNHSFHRDIWARTAEESLLNTHIPNMMVNEILQYAMDNPNDSDLQNYSIHLSAGITTYNIYTLFHVLENKTLSLETCQTVYNNTINKILGK